MYIVDLGHSLIESPRCFQNFFKDIWKEYNSSPSMTYKMLIERLSVDSIQWNATVNFNIPGASLIFDTEADYLAFKLRWE